MLLKPVQFQPGQMQNNIKGSGLRICSSVQSYLFADAMRYNAIILWCLLVGLYLYLYLYLYLLIQCDTMQSYCGAWWLETREGDVGARQTNDLLTPITTHYQLLTLLTVNS